MATPASIAEQFTTSYYQTFDTNRPALAALYVSDITKQERTLLHWPLAVHMP